MSVHIKSEVLIERLIGLIDQLSRYIPTGRSPSNPMASPPRRPTVIHVGARKAQDKKKSIQQERSSNPSMGLENKDANNTSVANVANTNENISKETFNQSKENANPYNESSSRKSLLSSSSSSRNRISPSESFQFNRENIVTKSDKKPGFFSRYKQYFYSNNSKDRGYWNKNQVKQQRRIGLQNFYLTRCCCYSIMAALVALVLLLALLAVIIIMALQPKARTTTTTTTTSTSTSSTSATTTTATTSTTTSVTTVTPLDACTSIRFNQTGKYVVSSSAKAFNDPTCLYIDSYDIMYICDHHNNKVQKWVIGQTSGTTIAGAGTGATETPHAQALTFDKNGFMYVTSHEMNAVERFPPNSSNGTAVAGTIKSGAAPDQLDGPTDLYVDDNFNLYVTDAKNNRVMKWAANATSGVSVISSSLISGIKGILPVPNAANKVYLSDESKKAIYLWDFNAANPALTLTNVTSMATSELGSVQRMTFDNSSNLFVADKDVNRVVMFCVNSTVGFPVVGEGGTNPAVKEPLDMAFDSHGDLYVLLKDNAIVKYNRL